MPFTSYAGEEVGPEFSPDGNQLAFAWQDAGRGNFDIFVKLVGAGEPLQLTRDSADDLSPAWSPDGRHIAFARMSLAEEGFGVFLIPALGGAERNVGQPAAEPRAGRVLLNRLLAWSPDGRFIAVTDRGSEEEPNAVFLLSPETGEKRKLTSPPAQYRGDFEPAFSPDGRNLAFVRSRTGWQSDVYLVPVGRDGSAGGTERRLTFDNRAVSTCAWTSDSRSLVFSSDRAGGSNLWSVPIEGGEATRLAVGADGVGGISVSRDGSRLAYAHSARTENIWRSIGPNTEAPEAGKDALLRLVSSTRLDREPQYPPDGQRIAFKSTRSGRDEIWVSNADGQNPVQLTSLGRAADPRWSPDGRWIAFGSPRTKTATSV
jgi:Tol biopolymer transport system component